MQSNFVHPPSGNTADFGFADVAAADKTGMVGEVFSQVAPYYDRMNDLMSGGLHRLWKRLAVQSCHIRPGMKVLDIACGSGDLSARILPRLLPDGKLFMADINAAMLQTAKQRIQNPAAFCMQCDAEQLPFDSGMFDRVIIGFGLRNVTRREQALAEIRRVLRPGGMCVILEFTPPRGALASLRERYLTAGLPHIGRMLFGDEESYRYLGESIMRFPPPQQLCEMMQDAGLERADYASLPGGAALLHTGWRLV